MQKKIGSGLESECRRMLSVIHHRGPNAEGLFSDGNIALGHRRLSIIDLSEEGNQPFHYKDRYVLTYNGEIYNYIELRRELSNKGYTFKTESDTEVLIASYDCWGEECLDKFNGMWAFAIYDREKRDVFFSRDRFGVKPFYYYASEDEFIFASEIKQILEVRPSLAIMDRRRVDEFLLYGITDGNGDTFFRQIKSLLPGSKGRVSVGENLISISRWYEVTVRRKRWGFNSVSRKFRDLFVDSVRLRNRSDVPVGSCLSGGLDSSAIVCTNRRILETDEMNTVSSCFRRENESRYDEQEFIDDIVDYSNAKSYKIYPEFESVVENMDDIIYHMDEPLSGMSICMQWEVFQKAAKQGLTVMLDGQGSDEELAGYTSFYLPALIDYTNSLDVASYIKALRFLSRRGTTENISIRKLALGAIYHSKWMRPFRKEKHRHRKNEPLPFEVNIPERDRIYDFDRFTIDMVTGNLQSLLKYEDRNSMAHSIETRLPFLDYRIVELCMSISPRNKMKGGYTKAVLRKAMEGILPDTVRLRVSKLGFAAPEELWMKENESWVSRELNEACVSLSDLIDKDRILSYHNKITGRGDVDKYAFRIICLARWKRIFNVC